MSKTSAPRLLLAHTTCSSTESARNLARGLVERHLAACVSIGAETASVYPWQGRIEVEQELPLLIKTCPARLDALKDFLAVHHDYEVPELLVTPVIDGSEAYLNWAEGWMHDDD
ncbi:MAG: divalent-cation tolerance protein CutA [Wenzhouxiangella sp.]|nr:MAG: divalent-cation tolerance protein CutA [Wenzhouxiangella sp.]